MSEETFCRVDVHILSDKDCCIYANIVFLNFCEINRGYPTFFNTAFISSEVENIYIS